MGFEMRPRNVVIALSVSAATLFLVAACGSSDSTFDDSPHNGDPAFGTDGSFTNDPNAKPDAGDPYANDPPQLWCGPNPQDAPPPPGGTPDCPSDKNKPGCGCDTVGQTAACWTGLRANRELGACKDGTTTCMQKDENTKAWGPCDGEVLPSGTTGPAACKCFSRGQWKLANLSPCFIEYNTTDPAGPWYAYSGTLDPGDAGTVSCTNGQTQTPPPTKPTGDWTTDTLNVDCAGHFKLCYELKAGDFANPQASDCSLSGKICVEADYAKENVEQTFPPIGSWVATDTACATKWQASGGYGEMTVIGKSVRCDVVDDGKGNPFVFNRVKYCPQKCQNGQNPTDPECANCQTGGSGEFH